MGGKHSPRRRGGGGAGGGRERRGGPPAAGRSPAVLELHQATEVEGSQRHDQHHGNGSEASHETELWRHGVRGYGREIRGFTGVPLMSMSKCRCAPVELPVLPSKPVTSPFTTSQPLAGPEL